MSEHERHYPYLESCRVTLRNANSSTMAPVRLQADVVARSRATIPEPYDFSLEKGILKTRDVRESDRAIVQADSRDELQQAVLVKMKNVTNADEDVCIALLESNGYDVTTSIEAFFQSN